MKAFRFGYRSTLAAALALVFVGFSQPLFANQVFTTSGTLAADGTPVSASADFTVTAGQIVIALTDTLLLSDLHSTAQLLTDISFSVLNGPTSVTQTDITAPNTSNLVTFNDGAAPTLTTGSGNRWVFGLNGTFGTGSPIGTGTYLLDALVGSPLGTFIAPTTTTATGTTLCTPANNKCPDGIGSPNRNPMFNGSATFTITNSGFQNGATISNVSFSFGTQPDAVLAGVPIPAAVWLFGSGLLGLIGIARRKPNSHHGESKLAAA